MIGRLCAAIVILGIATSAASAAVEYRGRARLSSLGSDCDRLDLNVRRAWTAHYRPANVGGNDKSTSLSLFGPYYTTNFTLPKDELSGIFRNANATYISGAPGAYVARIKRTKQRNVTNSSIELIEGDIQRFGGVQGCNVRYRLENLERVR
jgi:hypothetical protein